MYTINDKQIDFILNDIRRRGVEMEDLQYNLLDHICCIIEQNLNPDGDFEDFYKKTIPKFFKHGLWEIEEETINLLIFKNYYTMKKIMIYSGTISSAIFFAGLVLKFLHQPGAAVLIFLGITILSLVFLPLLLILKIKEKEYMRDKIAITIGTVSGIALSLGTLFKVMHWPLANVMILSSVLILVLLFLPFYLVSGLRNPETKVNTIVSSVLIFGACGLLFTLMRSPKGTFLIDKQLTENYLQNEKLFQAEVKTIPTNTNSTTNANTSGPLIIELCEKIKKQFITVETGSNDLFFDFEKSEIVLHDHTVLGGFDMPEIRNYSIELKKLTEAYNKNLNSGFLNISFGTGNTNSEANSLGAFMLLDRLIQIQRTVLHNERSRFAIQD